MRLFGLFVIILLGTYLNKLTAQNVTVSGAVSGNGNYSSLSAAFTGINGAQTGAAIVITINASFAEVASATLGSNTWTSVTIQPSGGGARTITSAFNPLLEFNGADNVTVDGLNSGGNSLTLDYSSNSASACTVRFINDALNNTVTRCTIKGSSTGLAGNINDGGVVSFSTTNGTTGNDNNTISYCDIGPSGASLPYTCIRSYATNNKGNDNITITNNTIHDFFNGTISGNVNANGIYIVTYASDWTITNNRFYQSATRTFTVGGQASYRTIRVSSGVSDANAGNFNISNNIIGYQNSAGTGITTIDVNANLSIEFEAIILEAGSNGALSTISGNTIANIDFTTSRAPASSGLTNYAFFGIYVSGAATVSNNTIGSTTGVGSITVRSRQTTLATTLGVGGIISRGTIAQTITGNTFGAITVVKHASATQNTMTFAAIENEGSGNSTFSSNTIGSSTANNIKSDETSGNIIGINLVGTGGTITVSSNTIQNLNHTGLNTLSGTQTSVLGISCSGTGGGTYSVSQNTITGLSNTYSATSVATQVTGIYLNQSGSGHTVSGNRIYGFNLSNANASAVIDGIRLSQGTMTISNNMVTIGTGVANNNLLIGINVKGGTPSLYYNTLVITGSYGGATNSATDAIVFESCGSGTILVNNILYNTRSTTASSHNVALMCNSMAQVTNITTCNYNNIYWSGTGSNSGGISPTYYTTLGTWQGASSRDANSISQSVSFVNIASDLHITDDCNLSGKATVISVTTDYDNQTRSSFPDIGADEYNLASWIGITSSDWSTSSNWAPAAVPTSTSDVVIPSGTPFSCTISSANGNCRSISINASASFSIISDKTLTLNANCTYGGFANNGSFSPGSGIEEVAFNGLGIVLGTVTFNIVSTNNGLTFSTTTTTVNKKFRIDAGGYVVANPPIYTTSTSTLQYNTGGVYNRSLEWSTGSGAGYPYHVQVSNNTTLNPGRSDNAYTAVVFNCGANLTIDAGSALSMDYGGHNMTVPLIVGNDVTNNGSLSLSGTTPGDIKVGGNWTRDAATGNFIPNCRAVYFTSTTADQTVTVAGGGTEVFNYVVIDKTGRKLLIGANTNMKVSATNACVLGTDYLTLTNGDIDLQGRTLYFEGPTGLAGGTLVMNFKVKNGTRSILSSVPGGIVNLSSTSNSKTVLIADGGGAGKILFGNNVEVQDGNGEIDFGAGNLSTINYIFRINVGGAVVGNAAYYAQGSKLIFSLGTVYDLVATQQSWETGTLGTTPGVPWDVEVNLASTDVRISDNLDRCVRDNISILNGTFELGATGFLASNLTVGGNWTRNNSGTAFIPNQNKVTFNSSVNAASQLQTITMNGGGNETYYDLEENNSPGLTLSGTTDAYVTNHLYLTSGLVNTSGNEVYVTNTAAASITFDASNGSADSWIDGYLRRKVTTGSYDFPVGVSTIAAAAGYELMTLNFTSNTNVDNLQMSFTTDVSPLNEPYSVTVNGTPLNNRLNAGWWTVRPYNAALALIASPVCNYNVSLYERGQSNSQADPAQYAVIKRDASYCFDACATSWTQCGVHINSTQWEAGGTAYAARSGFTCNSFSDWAIGFADIILPIEITTFDVMPDNADAILTWITSAELNSDFFGVERSTDGITFNQIGIVKAAGQSVVPRKYSLVDHAIRELAVPKIYYRLRMVDLDQSYNFSEVRLVDLNNPSQGDAIVVYPNPFDDQLNILWNAATDESASISLSDVAGRILIEKQISIVQGANVISLNEIPSFAEGVYFLHIFSGKEVLTQKLVRKR